MVELLPSKHRSLSSFLRGKKGVKKERNLGRKEGWMNEQIEERKKKERKEESTCCLNNSKESSVLEIKTKMCHNLSL